MSQGVRRKALLIGINYKGSQNELQGCVNDVQNMASWLVSRGYSSDPRDMVFLTDERSGPYYPTGHNILAAMDWLVKDSGCCLFLHYSGHGGQVPDQQGTRRSGFNDTIVPVDFQEQGQIDSTTLHRHLVSNLPPDCTLFTILDCCHSGSALELPYVYRTDEYGNVNLMDNVKMGMELAGEAEHLIQGGFSFQNIGEAAHLLGGAKDFFKGLEHQFGGGGDDNRNGVVADDDFDQDWSREDAFIAGRHVGAMSWSFLETMKQDRNWNMTYIDILTSARQLLQQQYSQIPQLSCGYTFDLNMPFRV